MLMIAAEVHAQATDMSVAAEMNILVCTLPMLIFGLLRAFAEVEHSTLSLP